LRFVMDGIQTGVHIKVRSYVGKGGERWLAEATFL
jgi:hypothetical protein